MAKLDIGAEEPRRIRIKIDRVFPGSLDVVDELAVPAREVCDDPVIADEALKIVLAQRLPDQHFLRTLALAKAKAVECGEIGHSALLSGHAPRKVTTLWNA